MDKSKIQKVNKALIATVFASSGIAVVVPSPQKAEAATSPFTDINQYSDNYNEILKLNSQGVMSGFADNTFRPDVSVTRGEAAKMLATALKLDTKNIQDPYYKDVPKGSQYYKYVAALQNAGIMSGYSNGTFMPNEVLTRGELAKIVVVGFHLEVSPTYNNIFKDVNSQTSNAIYIQTLIDLNVTKGTTPVTFSPFDAVTRGQFASFVVGSQEKKNNETSYKITSVDDDAVYINGQSYTIPESLSHIFNDYNAPVLKGALIEGDLSSKAIRSISKLTLNASGTSSRSLDFDGEYGSLNATIVVNGNYIEFSNLTMTGTMFVNETVRPPLHLGATYNQPLALGRVASNNISFINWSNPDNNKGEDSSNNNSTNDLQNWTNPNSDKDKPLVNWSKEKQEMKNVEKYLEFYNSTVSRLVVSQTGTKIETNTKLPRVDIIGNVREFEIQGDIDTLNLNTETKLTIYGSGNIDWINYNSYTDLELYIDGRIGTLFVDNSYGKIDIGDYTYIDKVILPKDGSPNNIFDDFLDDKDNIGNITDPDGKPIDKDENENQVPDDKTKPTVSITNVKVLNGSEIQADFTSDEVGTYYYIVREKGAEAPNKSEMVNHLSNENVAYGSGAAVKGTNSIKVSNLGEKKEYVIYIMVVDGSKNASDIVSQAFQMKDGTPPKVENLNVTALHGGTRAKFTFKATEPGDYYYYVRKKTSAPAPTTADIVADPTTGKGKAIAGNLGIEDKLTGLEAETEYQLYVVMKDESGNFSIDPAVWTDFTTEELDDIAPFIPIEKQRLELTGLNEITVHFSEPLDEEAAKNVKNYVLSGTGIMSISGQKEINPSKVDYKENDTKVTLTIPSATGLINNDTIRVTIEPTLYDLAGNEFENSRTHEKPRNFAVYTHEDTRAPLLTIKSVETNDQYDHGLLNVNASKAGTYYYVILPANNRVSDLSMRDIMDKKLNALLPSGTNNELTLQDVPLNLYGGSRAIEIGDSQLNIPIPNNLTKFHSWSIYIFMADRSGNLTEKIQTIELVKDRTAPEIMNGIVKPQEGDATAKLDINSNEAGQIRYILKRKDEQPPTLEEVKNSSKTLELKEGPQTTEVFAVPEAHKDFVLYYVARDLAGNTTEMEKAEFYSDGTKPKVEDVIVRDENKFEITFSEAIMRGLDEKSTINLNEGDSLDSLLVMTGANLSDYKFVSYTQGTKTTEKSKLVIKFTGTPSTNGDKTFSITMSPDVIDSVKAKHTFDLNDFGKYVFRSLDTMFVYAKLVSGDNKKVDVLVDLLLQTGSPDFEKDEKITYYYLSAPIGTSEDIIKNKTPEKIIEDVLSNQSNNSLAKGKGSFTPDDSRFKESLNHPVEFVEGDWIMIVLKDRYGNLIKTYQRVGYVYKP
ncbi:S-layer homology domain-containing protein [Lysinibacillus sp. ZYM-1]|uniref:S-layer homology domain-containing protein n=1 Tax=Lysinibacillus sp. ZYM-1 TaxID=1681184 RepID=UPI0006CE614F|nr:S-layer homology domain-containing protein [Lysinibacillus sp. ZYM-1]KPN97694.1 S-layer protein [Lysinibacillus sp. ZYM-1]